MIAKLVAGKLSATPNAAMTEVAIDGVGVIEPLLQQVVAASVAVVTPAGTVRYRSGYEVTVPLRTRVPVLA